MYYFILFDVGYINVFVFNFDQVLFDMGFVGRQARGYKSHVTSSNYSNRAVNCGGKKISIFLL